MSRTSDTDFIAMEDGFIRSIFPGPESSPLSLVLDRSGIHYDCRSVSDLERLIEQSAANADRARCARAAAGIRYLRARTVSKYNHAPWLSEEQLGLDPSRRRGRVLVVDQTRGDCSITYGQASHRSFDQMLEAAIDENPDAEIAVKLHPEVVLRRKKGHFARLKHPRVKLISVDVNPWALIENVDAVYVVTSQLGFEAVLGEKKVVCFGVPFYAGWGLTDDRVPIPRRTARPTREQIFAAAYFDYARYISPVTRNEMSFEDAVDWIVKERARLRPAAVHGHH